VQTDRQTAIITMPTVATGATVAHHSVHNMNTIQCVQKVAGDKSNTDFETAADYRCATYQALESQLSNQYVYSAAHHKQFGR
jgi:hypothetical protein